MILTLIHSLKISSALILKNDDKVQNNLSKPEFSSRPFANIGNQNYVVRSGWHCSDIPIFRLQSRMGNTF